ncbi:hypothetical protein CCACVL1_25440 [Corchorus capsularis]|uniref:Uncharacterized protein n=1 Tax=Corchorus capsularis TaxID=210143 RepID=A0A1R3GKE3_COCAP|nr:hypothetical protein CCACVL1_25440 [Corchorus capsularis]
MEPLLSSQFSQSHISSSGAFSIFSPSVVVMKANERATAYTHTQKPIPPTY